MSKLVLVESPFRAITEAPTDYVVRSMRDAFSRGEFPFASHRLYPGVLDDRWDAAAEAMGVTSDELARRASVMRGKKSNGAAALPEGAFG